MILRAMDINRTAPRYEFADLVDEYSTSVYKFCRSLTYSKEDADDLLQDTFLKAVEQFRKASDNPQSFLFSTASFLWKSRKRKYARRNRLAPVEPLDDTLISGENVEDSFIEKEETRIVRQLVETLPEKLKTPVILYYTIEMSVQDIAQTLKIPAGTVKSRLFKARKIIEKGLIGYEK